MRAMRLPGALLALATLLEEAVSLKIAAFNIQTFGETKMSNATLVSYIVQILSRYDIALVQEVRDSHLTAVGKLLDNLNQDAPDTYRYVVSEPLGRNNYKERYLFVYRPDQVSAVDSYYYDDGCEPCGNDTFSREPAIVKFSSPFTDAVAEIDALYDVYLDVQEKWGLEVRPYQGQWVPAASTCPWAHRRCFLVGYHVDGRLQCGLQLCETLPMVIHPPSDKPHLPVADPRHRRHHGYVHALRL
ncbi:deoxyribonuclease-1 isoform X6 [Aotus nancymaae]|uniref:deoxyribonuclease-1 isoform X6 n=1 Tax=Aotus nancymaae TaxID=37293 RepID=UPI0030FE4114